MRALQSIARAALVLLATSEACAAKIDVVGLLPGKAIVSVDGAAPRTMTIGDAIAGFRLLTVNDEAATFLVDGRRETVAMGSFIAGHAEHGRATAVLGPDTGGHYLAQGAINGTVTRFLVDTGATMVVISSREADRLHLVWANGPQAAANTANGRVAYRIVKLDRVKVGDVELTGVDAGVLEGYDGPNLLGMSFLSRTEVSRDGQSMVLTWRF